MLSLARGGIGCLEQPLDRLFFIHHIVVDRADADLIVVLAELLENFVVKLNEVRLEDLVLIKGEGILDRYTLDVAILALLLCAQISSRMLSVGAFMLGNVFNKLVKYRNVLELFHLYFKDVLNLAVRPVLIRYLRLGRPVIRFLLRFLSFDLVCECHVLSTLLLALLFRQILNFLFIL